MVKSRNYASELRQAFKDGWPPTVRFVEWASGVAETPEETLSSEMLETLRLKPTDAKVLFDGIEDLELGKFIVGRRGGASRIRWLCTLPSIGAVGKGDTDRLEALNHNSLPKKDPARQGIEHVYQLRRDRKVSFVLPDDLSPQEAARLAAFIQTLPFPPIS